MLIKIEEVAEEPFLFFVFVVRVVVRLVAIITVLFIGIVIIGSLLKRLAGWCLILLTLLQPAVKGIGAFNDLIELATIQPYAPAFRAIINLHAVAVSHDEGFITIGTIHIVRFKNLLRLFVGYQPIKLVDRINMRTCFHFINRFNNAIL